MKAIYISLLLASIMLRSNAQSLVLSKVVNITPPENSVRLNMEQLTAFEKANFKYLGIPKDNQSNNFYLLGNIIVCFWDSPSLENPRSLEAQRTELINIFKEYFSKKNRWTLMETKIDTVNNIRFFIEKHKISKDNTMYLWFYSEFSNHRDLYGLIQYKEEEDNKADKILNDLLKTITFK